MKSYILNTVSIVLPSFNIYGAFSSITSFFVGSCKSYGGVNIPYTTLSAKSDIPSVPHSDKIVLFRNGVSLTCVNFSLSEFNMASYVSLFFVASLTSPCPSSTSNKIFSVFIFVRYFYSPFPCSSLFFLN